MPTTTPAAPASMSLADFAGTPVAVPGVVVPLLPVRGPLNVAGGALILAVCTRGSGEPRLCRFKPGRKASASKPATEPSWTGTDRIADIARAIAGGLLT